MERAGRFLGSALRRLKRPEAGTAWLIGAWPEIVGETLAAHVRPVSCESGQLEIAVDGKEWANQIRQMEREFCAQINCAWGGDLVTQVTLIDSPNESQRTSTAQRLPRELDNDHTPFVRRRYI